MSTSDLDCAPGRIAKVASEAADRAAACQMRIANMTRKEVTDAIGKAIGRDR